MIVKIQRPIKFINDCECIVNEKELEQAIVWYTSKPVCGTKKIFMHGKYPAVAIYKEKIHVHRLLMMYWMNRRLSPNEYVHHLNGNKFCCLKSNLAVMMREGHQSHHNKGRKFSEKHRKLLSEANRRRAGKVIFKKRHDIPLSSIKEMLDAGYSINKIADHFKVDWSTIKSRINEHPHLLKGEENT